jgi:U4/U6 small nuclear ribonucleoprotein PRP4
VNLATWLGAASGPFGARHDRTVYGVGWSPDGSVIASTRYDGLLQLWDATSGARLAALPTNDKPNVLAWSPRGDTVAVGDDTGACELWNATTRTSAHLLTVHPLGG